MTRSSKLALVTLLAGLLSLASVATVGADSPCTGMAPEHCAAMAAATVESYLPQFGAEHYEEIISAVDVATGASTDEAVGYLPQYAREHFEATTEQVSLFAGAASAPAPAALPLIAPEHFEATAAVWVTATEALSPQFGQEHYEEIMAARDATN